MSRPLDWNREGLIWPRREASQFVPLGSARWHVQRFGPADGASPRILLLHGTGASVHSWRGLVPLLEDRFDVLAMDLPRHAFTTGHAPHDLSLPRMAASVQRLIEHEGFAPDLIAGHSAGAALALQLALDHGFEGPIVGLNAALRPFPGPAAQLFPAFAKLLFVNPVVPRLFSAAAGFGSEADRFLYRSTGSNIEREGLACYAHLLRNPVHTKGALAMMANWDLPTLRTRLVQVSNPIRLVHSTDDAAIPLDWAREVDGWLPSAQLDVLEGLGHLAHEEAPEHAARAITEMADALAHKA